MHSLSSFMMRYQHRSVLARFRIDERLDAIRDRIKRMKNVEECGTSGQYEIFSKSVDATNSNEHTNGTAQSKKGPWVEIQLRVRDEGLTSSSASHHVTHFSTQLSPGNGRDLLHRAQTVRRLQR